MAGRVAVAALAVFLAAAVSAAGVREQAGMARALLGAGPEALDLLGRDPAAGSRADRYFRALALDRAGFRAAALGVWAELAATDGPFSGPALEAAVDREFVRGRYERVAALAAAANPGRLADPDTLWYRVGQSLRMLGRNPEAAEVLGRVSQGPFLPYALHTLAQIRFEEDRHAEALDLLARAVEAAPEPLADRIRLTRGRILYQVAVGLLGLDPEARERGLQVARDQFGRIQPESPWYAQALEGMGWCDLELGATAEALAAFTLAAERDPDRAPLYLWAQGRAYEAAGILAEAARQYAAAREAALERAEALEARAAAPGPDPVWAAEAGRTGPVESRIENLGRRANALQAALDVREAFLAARARRVDAAAARLAALAGELDHMKGGIAQYLDRVSVAALVPAEARPRIAALTARHRALDREIGRLHAAARALEGRAPGAARTLEARVLSAAAGLAGARARFLEGLRDRVSQRQKELAARIGELQDAARGVEPAVGAAREAVAAQARAVAGARERLQGLRARLEAAAGRLGALRDEALARGRDAAAARLRARAAEWRRRADLYALDETQALHLLREGGGQ